MSKQTPPVSISLIVPGDRVKHEGHEWEVEAMRFAPDGTVTVSLARLTAARQERRTATLYGPIRGLRVRVVGQLPADRPTTAGERSAALYALASLGPVLQLPTPTDVPCGSVDV